MIHINMELSYYAPETNLLLCQLYLNLKKKNAKLKFEVRKGKNVFFFLSKLGAP